MDLMETDDICTDMPNCGIINCTLNQDEPRDLSIKRKMRPVPPPLDLTKRTLELEQLSGLTFSPRSPHSQKNLPLRKRAFSWSSHPENLQLQLPQDSCPDHHDSRTFRPTELPSSASVCSLRTTGLSTPHTPPTPHPNSAIPIISNRFIFGDTGHLSNASHGPLNLSTGSMNAFPSSLLSPAPSSSLSSSREELEPEVGQDFQMQVVHTAHPNSVHSGHVNVCEPLAPMVTHVKSEFNSNNITIARIPEPPGVACTTPNSTNHNKYSPTWSVFQSGVQIHFVFGATHQITSAATSDRLGQIEQAQNRPYAPNGLHVLRVSVNHHASGAPTTNHPYCQLYMRPVMVQQEDIIAMPPVSHPFYVHEKGWCSVNPELTVEQLNISFCHLLQEGDLVLPPNHPEVAHTPIPILTEAMQKFDFNDENFDGANQTTVVQPVAVATPQTQRLIFISPPASPSKKTVVKSAVNSSSGESTVPPPATTRSRRPMNGFMLFAKFHRLKLIQQYPGKDNRAISVLLGSMWKGLSDEGRDKFNAEARLKAEERKRIDPDCWKRKRSHSTS